MTRTISLSFLLLLFCACSGTRASVICYECHANSTEQGKFCSIDKLCEGTSCYFQLYNHYNWSAGCSTSLSSNVNITCSAPWRSSIFHSESSNSIAASCSCNSDFCNSLLKSKAALLKSNTEKYGWSNGLNIYITREISLTMPDRGLVYCDECGSVTVGNQTIQIPCDHNHTCQGNYCVAVGGQAPYSYCGGVWDAERASACYFDFDKPETCICSMNMCNGLLDPEPLYTTVTTDDPTLATQNEENPITPVILNPVGVSTTGATQKPLTKRKCRNARLSPNDQAVYMGEKLKNVILGGFGSEDEAVQNFEDDINEHICNYSEDE